MFGEQEGLGAVGRPGPQGCILCRRLFRGLGQDQEYLGRSQRGWPGLREGDPWHG